ncbi:site-specific DNA-methyltransferase [bacterium]|nr:site-specific DNA-methyltransferase [bacterium]
MRQRQLMFDLPIFDIRNNEISYNNIHIRNSTFKGGVDKLAHRWFRLTPSFGPDLVDHVLDHFGFNEETIVLDPFAGASTTLIECQINNLKCYGFELHPFLKFVGSTCLNWELDAKIIEKLHKRIIKNFNQKSQDFRQHTCEELPYSLTPIHNVYRWWRPDVLKDMLIFKHSIYEECNDKPDYKDFFILCFAAVLVPDLTNVTLGRLQLFFIDRSEDNINVVDTYNNHFDKMLYDIKEINSGKFEKKAELFHTDTTDLSGISINDKIDIVMTSPPYPNRYSYVWNTRPHLYLFDFFKTPKEAADLDKKLVGGTWGTATSCLGKGIVEPLNETVKEYVYPIAEKIREVDNLMANYLMKYFNLLTKQILEMDKILSDNAKVAYVVGVSRIKEVYVETDVILANIFKSLNLGYNKVYINRFRKRHSGKDLYESIVYAEKLEP